MKILMMTNTYKPHVGGVARSVEAFTAEYRSRGHRVVVVAPKFENTPAVEEDVVRLFAIQHFKGSDFSVRIPIPGRLGVSTGTTGAEACRTQNGGPILHEEMYRPRSDFI